MFNIANVVANLKKVGYGEYLAKPVKDAYFLYRTNPTTKEPEMVVVVNCITTRVSNKEAVNDIRKYAMTADKLGIQNPEDILVVLVGIFNSNYVSGKNIIRLNNDTAKMRGWRIDERYKDAKEACRYVSRLNKAIDKNYMAGLEACDRPIHSPLPVVLLILFTLYFSATNFANGSLYAINVAGLKNGETYRLLTYMFVHGGVWHLAGNMISLYYIGRRLVARLGAIDFFLIYILGGISAGAMSMWIYLTMFNRTTVSTVGASGAIFAVLGAWLATVFLDHRCEENKGLMLKNSILVLIISSVGFNIDWACHISGFLVGIVTAVFIVKGHVISADAKEFGTEQSIDRIKEVWEEKSARIRNMRATK